MSVKVIDRNVSELEFLKNARDIEIIFLKLAVDKPKRYKFFYQKITEVSIDILNHLKQGNSIYVERKEDVLLRTEKFKLALAEVQAIVSQLEVIYYLFKDEAIGIKQIEILSEMLNKEIGLIKGLLKADREKYKKLLDDM